MKKLFLFFAALFTAASMWAVDFVFYDGSVAEPTLPTAFTDQTTQFTCTPYNLKTSLQACDFTVNAKTYAKNIKMGGGSTTDSNTGNPKNTIKFVVPTGYTADLYLVYLSTAANYIGVASGDVVKPSSSNATSFVWHTSVTNGGTGSHLVQNLSAGTYYICGSGDSNQFAEIKFSLTALKTEDHRSTAYSIKVDGVAQPDAFDVNHSITLSSASLYQPEVTLVATTTVYYDDATQATLDPVETSMTVALDGEGDNWIATYEVESVTYTVTIPVDKTPVLEVSSTSETVEAIRNIPGKATFTIQGTNLTNNVTLVFASEVAGLTVSPSNITLTNGSVASTTVTITYDPKAEVSANSIVLTVSSGSIQEDVTINYSATAPIAEMATIGSNTTWDFTGYTENIEAPNTGVEYILANLGEYKSGFNAEAIKGKQQYAVRSGLCWQGTELTFHPTVAGAVKVVWSSTGSSNHRTLKINEGEYAVAEGITTTSLNNAKVTIASVPADEDVKLTGWDYKNSQYTANQIRIWSVSFITSVDVEITSAGYATLYLPFDATIPENVTAYTAAYADNTLTLNPIEGGKIKANTGVVLKGAPTTYTFTATTGADDMTSALTGVLTETTVTNNQIGGQYVYTLAKENDVVGFYLYSGSTLAANKAYLPLAAQVEKPMTIVFTDEVTGVEDVRPATGIMYDIMGRQIANPVAGQLYIMDGVKYIAK